MSIIRQLQDIPTEDGALLECKLEAEQLCLRLLLWNTQIVSLVFRDWFCLRIARPEFVGVDYGEGNLDRFRVALDADYLPSVLRGEGLLYEEDLAIALQRYEAIELTTIEEAPYDVAFSLVTADVEIKFEPRPYY